LQPVSLEGALSGGQFLFLLAGVTTENEGFLDRANFRLPTEAEWEYAARAGTTTRWSSGDDPIALLEHAWVRANTGGVVQPVGTRLPNPWDLFDMHGNVWEWVSDWHAPDYFDRAPEADPTGPSTGTEKVRRGGSVMYSADNAASTHRYQQPPGRGNGNLGFRVAADDRTVRSELHQPR